MIAMVGVIASNGLILVAQYQLRRSSSKTSVNIYVASLSVSAIIFAVIFGPTVFTARFQTLAPPLRLTARSDIGDVLSDIKNSFQASAFGSTVPDMPSFSSPDFASRPWLPPTLAWQFLISSWSVSPPRHSAWSRWQQICT